VGMGIIPLQFLPNETAETLGLTGKEDYTIELPNEMKPGQHIKISTNAGKDFNVILRFDTEVDLLFYKHGGILNYMIRKIVA
jgi:aconitate hydratase